MNGGMSWSPLDMLTDQGFTHGTLFVRQDPHNSQVLFATGGLQLELFRSLDFGTTWARAGNEFDLFDAVDCAVSEASSSVVLVLLRSTLGDTGHRYPLWRSEDGGNTFVEQTDTGLPISLYTDDGYLLAQPFFSNIATTRADPNIVYAVQYADFYGYYQPSIYKSVDGGAHFTRLESGPPHPLQVFPHPTLPNVLFAQDVSGPSLPSIYRSLDGGETFEPLTNGLPEFGNNNFVALDPRNPSFVYVAGTGGFFKSSDGGNTFSPLGLTAEQRGTTSTTASVDPTNSNILYVNTNRGNFKSSNGGLTFAAINKGWKGAITRSIALDNSPDSSLYVSASSGGGILRTRTRGASYEAVPHPSSLLNTTLLAVSPNDPQLIFAGTTSRLFKTSDGGASWAQVGIDTGSVSFSPSKSKIAFSSDPNNIYFSTESQFFPDSGGIYKSTDSGYTFERRFSFGSPDMAIAATNPNTLIIGVSGFDVPFTSLDGGLNFGNGPIYWAYVTDVAIDPTNSDNIYIYIGSILRSTDGGASYTPAAAGPAGNLIGFVIDPRDTARLFAWTAQGLFMSLDYGNTWNLLEGNETRKAAGFGHTILINPKKPNVLYLAGTTVLEVEIGN
jgi:photosystem II stability/assembly factor-like uncharacterized protein